jgi:nitrite reductase (NO-forming)
VGLNVGILAVLAGVATDHPVLTTAGAGVVAAVIGVHLAGLVRLGRRALQTRFGTITRFYVAAGVFLLAGIVFGTLLATGHARGVWDGRLHAAHVHTNVLGWVALTVLGTEFTLWPTALRTRMVEGTKDAAHRTLALTVVGLTATIAALLAGSTLGAAAGLVLYAAGLVTALIPLVRTAVQRHPHTAATWLLAAGTTWLAVAVVADVVIMLRAPAVEAVAVPLDRLVPVLLVGFVGQVLTGALTFLLPVVLGRGPAGARQATATLEQAWLPRIVAVNLGVLGLAVSGPSWLTALGWTLVVAALGAFVLLAASLLVTAEAPPPPPAPTASAPAGTGPGSGRRAVVVAGAVGLAIVLLGAAIAVGDLGHGAAAGGASTSRAAGATQVVAVSLGDMTIEPRSIDVPAGTNLVLDVTNRDRGRHDLKVADGPQTRRLAEGESQRLSVGVVTTGLDAWCTVPGHRAAGMTMAIHVSGAGTQAAAGSASDATVDPKATPGGGFTPYDPVLAPAPAGTEHAVTLPVVDKDIEVAPDVRQRMWTFGGTVPGPTLHGRVGDTFVVTLVNHGSMGHSIDFHAGSVSPDQPMRTIQPGESLVYRFTAGFAGAWMYHCGTAPMLDHIANGMYGAVVIDPPGLPPVDREFALVQSELYLGPPNGTADDAKLRARTADAVVFNGYVRQYDAVPLTAEPGQRVRIWVLNAGPERASAFHVVGTQFDTVFKEGAYLLRPGNAEHGGAQVLDLAPAQGGFVELVATEPGHYSIVTHQIADAEIGAHGVLAVG